MQSLKNITRALLPHQVSDAVAVGVVDFGSESFQKFEAVKVDDEIRIEDHGRYFF